MFELYVAGGSIGEQRSDRTKHINGRVYSFKAESENKEELVKRGKLHVKSLGGRNSYYKPSYRIIEKAFGQDEELGEALIEQDN